MRHKSLTRVITVIILGATPMPQKKGHKTRCNHCRQGFTAKRVDTLYCSKSCRQKASRRAKKSITHKDPVPRVLLTCAHCLGEYECSATRHNKRYCSPACRQAAYRKRREELVTALSLVALVQGYAPELVREHTKTWSMKKLQIALTNAKIDEPASLLVASHAPSGYTHVG
jgi:hypothetical protein